MIKDILGCIISGDLKPEHIDYLNEAELNLEEVIILSSRIFQLNATPDKMDEVVGFISDNVNHTEKNTLLFHSLGIVPPNTSVLNYIIATMDLRILQRFFSRHRYHVKNMSKMTSTWSDNNEHSNCFNYKIMNEIFSKNTNNEDYDLINYESRKPLKIAVCISGQLRGYKDAFKTWGNMIKDHDVDFYCSTWTKIGRKKLERPHVHRTFPEPLASNFKLITTGMTHDDMIEQYDYVNKKLEVSESMKFEDLSKLYSTEKVCVIDDDFFLNHTNPFKMYYLIEHCWNQITEPNKYDLVMRIRPDKPILNFDISLEKILSICKKGVVITDFEGCLHPNVGPVVGDQFAISTPDVMSIYSTTFSSLISRKSPFENEYYRNFMAHRSLYCQLVSNGIRTFCPREIKFGSPLDVNPIPLHEWEELFKKNISTIEFDRLFNEDSTSASKSGLMQ